MKKRILMLLAAICMICSFAAITVGAYYTDTDYTTNAQKLVNYILQKGKVKNDGSVSVVDVDSSSDAVHTTILEYDRNENQITFSYSMRLGNIRTLCYFDYDLSNARAVEDKISIGFAYEKDEVQKLMQAVVLPFYIRLYSEDDEFSVKKTDVFGPAANSIKSIEEFESTVNSVVDTAISSFKLLVFETTDLTIELEDIGFASLNTVNNSNNDTGTTHSSNNDTTIYAPDGRTAYIYHGDIEKFLQVGWYLYPVTTIYAPDGRTAVVEKSSVEAYKAVGWNTVPAITLYALNGSTINIWSSETAAYTAVGWYVGTTPITMYAPDGRTISVPIEQMTAYIGVGWSQYPIAA